MVHHVADAKTRWVGEAERRQRRGDAGALLEGPPFQRTEVKRIEEILVNLASNADPALWGA
jgi:hypothetical protein